MRLNAGKLRLYGKTEQIAIKQGSNVFPSTTICSGKDGSHISAKKISSSSAGK
jgi:hypothetical protein